MKTKLLSLAVLAALSAPSFAHQAGDIIVRAGAATVAPTDDTASPFRVDDNTQVGLNFAYMLTDNIGLELLAATPFTHDVSVVGGPKIAEVTHLPPTLSAQYYFDLGNIRPYVGVGINATIFFDEEFNSTGQSLGLSDLELESSIGLAAQVGVDYKVTDELLVNAAVWYMDIGTEVDYKDNGVSIDNPIDLDIDPWVYMVSVGYSF